MEPKEECEVQDHINGTDEAIAILSEDALRKLSKSLTAVIPKNVDSLEESTFALIQSTLQDLLHTASSTDLSFAHGAAALNALCGFLEQCSISSEVRIRYLSYKTETWTRAFNIYVTRSDNTKPKPLRRLLLTLVRSISNQPVEKEKDLLLRFGINVATQAIRKQHGFADIKAAIQVLEHFINSNLVDAAEVAQSERPEELGILLEKSTNKDQRNPDTQQEEVNQSVQRFALDVLEWMQYPDCAPAVGRFLPVYFKSIKGSQSDKALTNSKDNVVPLWISPVKRALEKHQGILEVFEIHILPGLLRLGPADVKAFLQLLPLERLQHGNIGSSSISDIQLCLLVAKTAEHSSLRSYFNQGNTLLDVENLGINLLEHSSSSVRIAAFSLLVFSPASARPFGRRVLRRLRRIIPYFHVEVNTKPRNEFIALIKKLCMRVQSATMSLLRWSQDPDDLTEKNPREKTHIPAPSVTRSDGEGLLSSGNVMEVPNQGLHILEEHLAFRKWYMVFLLQELRPTASYQSHITALKILEFLTEHTIALRNAPSKVHNDYIGALNEHLPASLYSRPLTELLLDPFDDVRQSANTVFDLHLSTNSNLQTSISREDTSDNADPVEKEARDQADDDEDLRKANNSLFIDLNKAEKIARTTGRADHADGFGRLYGLLFTYSGALAKQASWECSRYSFVKRIISVLEEEVNIAKDDLLFAVSSRPLHGHLIALKYIVSQTDYVKSLGVSLDDWKVLNRRIFKIGCGVWEVVHDVLCFDAPEGHEISEDDCNEQDIGSKDMLSFCWRALKESSSLMHAMVTNKGYIPSSLHESTDYEGYHKFGHLAFTQLAELRHRGAFSTVSHTFAACCTMCARSTQQVIRECPKTWYKLALRIIEDNAASLTRRSAGLPAIATGILAAYSRDKFFDDLIMELQAIAHAPIGANLGSLPQVHALNCLKDIFTDARFGPSTEIYVADSLEIAVSSLESQIWSLRNCGLMLFKALLKRLNGGTDTSSTKASSSHRRFSQLIYKKYPNLPDLLLRLLIQTPTQTQVAGREINLTMQAHRVFPALEVIESFGTPSQHHGPFFDALLHYNESQDWSIREKAAKALSLLVDETSIVEEVTSLLTPSWKSQNELHGRLLRLRLLLARNEAPLFGELLNTYEAIASIVEDSFETMTVRNACPITVAVFLNVAADLFIILILSNSKRTETFLLPVLAMVPENIAKCPALALQERPLGRCQTIFNYVHASKDRPQRHDNTETLHNLSEADTDALRSVNLALQNMSDENDLAVLRFCAARDLRWAPDVTQCTDTNVGTLSKNHRQFDYTLALRGYSLGERFTTDGISSDIRAWICLLSEAGAEPSDLRTRTAAVFSIRAFFDGLLDRGHQLFPDPKLLGVYLALYDSLVDDDEDVRDQGARVASTILSVNASTTPNVSTTALSLSPPAAKERLLQFVCENYRSSMQLCLESVRRLTGISLVLKPGPANMQDDQAQIKQARFVVNVRSVADLYSEAQKTSNIVFVEERQNLYIDSVSEAEAWTQLLLQLDSDTWPSNVASDLEAWCVQGLAHILKILQTDIDGALSPMSKPEVFTLFARVLLAAKVLIVRWKTRANFTEKGQEHVCVGLLENILDVGRSRLFHDLQLHRIQKIVEESRQ